jgi:hypothetical protein
LLPLRAGTSFTGGQARGALHILGTAEEARGTALRLLGRTRPTAYVSCTYQFALAALAGPLRNLQTRAALIHLPIHGTQADNPLAYGQRAAGKTLAAILARHALARGAEGFDEEQPSQADKRRITVFISPAMAVEGVEVSVLCCRKPGNELAVPVLGTQRLWTFQSQT